MLSDQGLVVRGSDWSETSRIVTLFTRGHGKIRALAKGARRLKSSFEFAFDLLVVCDVVFIHKASGLDLLTEAKLRETFPELRRSMLALNAGYYIAELLSDGTQDFDPHPQLYDEALETLRKLDQPGSSPLLGVCAFELVWLQELGYSPRLDACSACAQRIPDDLPATDWVYFSPQSGGVICRECAPAAYDRRTLSVPGWRALSQLVELGHEANVSLERIRELRQVLGHTVSSILGRKPRLLTYLGGE